MAGSAAALPSSGRSASTLVRVGREIEERCGVTRGLPSGRDAEGPQRFVCDEPERRSFDSAFAEILRGYRIGTEDLARKAETDTLLVQALAAGCPKPELETLLRVGASTWTHHTSRAPPSRLLFGLRISYKDVVIGR